MPNLFEINGGPINSEASAYETFTLTVPIHQRVYGAFTLSVPIEQSIYDSNTAFDSASRVRMRITLAGTDITEKLTGDVTVEAEEDMARTAEFTISPDAGVLNFDQWANAVVTVDYDRMSGTTVQIRSRLFTGIVNEIRYDPMSGRATFLCTDDLQGVMDLLTTDQIDALVPTGISVAAVQGTDLEGFEYLTARMEAVLGSFDLSPTRAPRLTLWAAKTSPDYTFTHSSGQVVDQSERVSFAIASQVTNEIESVFTYRYPRLIQRVQDGAWDYPYTFCDFNSSSTTPTGSSDLPNREMIIGALMGTGWVVKNISFSSFLPETGFYDCTSEGGGTIAWLIDPALQEQLVTGASWRLVRRFVRNVEETYTLTIRSMDSQTALGKKSKKVTSGFTAEYDTSEWINDLGTDNLEEGGFRLGGAEYVDEFKDKNDLEGFDREAASNAIDLAILSAKKDLLDAHRQTVVAFECLLDPRIDLIHTVRLNTPRILAKGKVKKVVHSYSADQNATSKTLVQIAISRRYGGVGVIDSDLQRPAVPAIVTENEPDFVGLVISKSTQLGGILSAPVFDEISDGFAGNFRSGFNSSAVLEPGSEVYPVRFQVTAEDIDEDVSSDLSGAAEGIYDVLIPNDELTITAP